MEWKVRTALGVYEVSGKSAEEIESATGEAIGSTNGRFREALIEKLGEEIRPIYMELSRNPRRLFALRDRDLCTEGYLIAEGYKRLERKYPPTLDKHLKSSS